MKRLITPLLLALAVGSLGAKVRPASIVTSDMVLQQQTDARLWGKADPGEKVTVSTSWDGRTYTAVTDRTGDWSLAVKTPEASFTPYYIEIAGSDNLPRRLDNVLIGEVWLASGQSNMQMPLKGFPGCIVEGGYDEIASAGKEAGKVRFATLPLVQSYEPLDTVDTRWVVPSPETAPEFSALAWHFAKRMSDVLGVPVGIVSAAYGGAKVESWSPREMVGKYSDISLDPKDIEAETHYLRPYLMYNAMFNPVRGYTYKGIIWYQGCSNVDSYATYPERLAAMVQRWRDDIGLGEIPFYTVEVAPYDYGSGNGPLIREAQHKAVALIPNSDIISTNDLVKPCERFNIHPSDKATAGKRLCDLALNKTYGRKQFLAGSPTVKGVKFRDGEAWVAIDSPNMGVCSNYDIRGFEVAGADRVFHPADSVRLHWQTNEAVVSSKEVPEPVAVRYCWGDFAPGTLYGGNHLPLIPWRSDNW